ncbi:hypothetical protein TRFO_39760 [Tritrichomonas foetus]|uniref:Ubiquitin-like domain-containing protein n=1 Tax=Tritrichomonas foetus TaxID=1144522 RepID=A0A1J4J3Q2_9EUKA|nr:hypothetical protein TRFO_39760 [Tritrichomonas foetus]|eukprot:OHS94054.1 hypothetical protein TRFO_39760 [Tritrichomonas foetus]
MLFFFQNRSVHYLYNISPMQKTEYGSPLAIGLNRFSDSCPSQEPVVSIEIKIYFPSKFIRKVLVSNIMKITSLRQSVVPNINCTFVFNGILIDEEKTFGYYNMRNNDVIVLSHQGNDNRWLRATHDSEQFHNHLKTMSNPRIASESYRIRDLQMMKCETRKKSIINMQKVIKRSNSCGIGYIPKEKVFPTIIPEVASEPMSDALQFIWGNE